MRAERRAERRMAQEGRGAGRGRQEVLGPRRRAKRAGGAWDIELLGRDIFWFWMAAVGAAI